LNLLGVTSEIALNHPENLTDLTDVIEKYVTQEGVTELEDFRVKQSREEREGRKEEKWTETKKSNRACEVLPILYRRVDSFELSH
jgi:hypothetical protein